LIAGSALSLLAASAVASAQSSGGSLPDLTPSGVSIRLGGVFALDGPLRNEQKLWFGGGLEYQLQRTLIADSPTYFSVDFAAQSGSGGHGSFFPICVNQRFYMGPAVHGSRGYLFLGAGVVIMNVTATNTTAALRAGIGYDVTPSVFLESSLLVTGQVDGFQGTSVGIFAGYRF
jgi:hypothetical protein